MTTTTTTTTSRRLGSGSGRGRASALAKEDGAKDDDDACEKHVIDRKEARRLKVLGAEVHEAELYRREHDDDEREGVRDPSAPFGHARPARGGGGSELGERFEDERLRAAEVGRLVRDGNQTQARVAARRTDGG